MDPLFVEDGEIVDNEKKRVATFFEISSPQQLEQLQAIDDQAENVVINLLDWQVFTFIKGICLICLFFIFYTARVLAIIAIGIAV